MNKQDVARQDGLHVFGKRKENNVPSHQSLNTLQPFQR